jgi:drug/metabolite transporter (DMT)-like permease
LKTLVILSGILGVFLVSLGKDPSSLSGNIVIAGILLMVAINILSGFTNVLVASDNKMIPPLVISSASMIIGGTALFFFSIPFEGLHFEAKPAAYYISLAWLSLLSAIAISIWITLLKRPGIKVSDLNLWKFLIPIFGAVMSWLLVPGEDPQLLSIIGMIIIAISLVLLNLVNRKKHVIIREKI